MSDFANPSTPWPSTGMLTLVLAESPNPFLRTTAPQLLIDSTPHLCHWGYNQIPLAPGPHRIRISMRPDKEWGIAETIITMLPEPTRLYYAPYGYRHEGRLGPVPPPADGARLYYGGLVFSAVFLGLALGLASIS